MSGNPKRKEKGIEEKKIAQRLRDATHLIHKQSEHAGLNNRFKEEIIKANEAAVALCEKAMESLSSVYIESLADFKDAKDALRSLSHLEKSSLMLFYLHQCLPIGLPISRQVFLFLWQVLLLLQMPSI